MVSEYIYFYRKKLNKKYLENTRKTWKKAVFENVQLLIKSE